MPDRTEEQRENLLALLERTDEDEFVPLEDV